MQRTTDAPKERNRNVAHLWADKRILRFFRKKFPRKQYKNLHTIYLALCEIDSDFGAGGTIYGFTRTVATYAGLQPDTVIPYLQALRKAEVIDYWQIHDDEGKFQHNKLTLYRWSEENEDKVYKVMEKFLGSRDPRYPENPTTVKPDIGISGCIKKDKDKSLSEFNKKKRLTLSERNAAFLPVVDRLREIIQSKKKVRITSRQCVNWSNEIRRLVEEHKIAPNRIDDALNWYENHIGEQYCPVIESGASLREKFLRLEAAAERSNGNRKPNGLRTGWSGSYTEALENLENKNVRGKG